MFCVKDTRSDNEYMIGDEMELCLSASKQYRFKCVLEDILENGQIVLGSLQVKVKDSYKKVDGHFKTGVYELFMVVSGEKGRSKYNSIALQYKGESKHSLISDTGEIIPEGTKIILEIYKEVSDITYYGIYRGISEKGCILLSDVSVCGKLAITNDRFSYSQEELSLNQEDSMYVEGYGNVRVG